MDNIFKAIERGLTVGKSLNHVPSARGWPWQIKEFNTGDWQKNITYERKDVLSYHAVFGCTTLIAGDIAKLMPRIVKKNKDGIWVEQPYTGYEVLLKPNGYQNRIQFVEAWILSKLVRGNSYVLKERNRSGDVIAMHVLHPDKVLPLVSDQGDVYYQLSEDNLSGLQESSVTVPASEIIHDRFNCLFHPLVGLSPIFASGLPAAMGQKILQNSHNLFGNGGRPGGILTVPEAIDAEKAAGMAQAWKTKYSGENYGNVAVLGGDVKYQSISMNADDAQLVEQLKMTAEMVCSCYHVPPYKVGIGATPAYNNVEALNLEYYSSGLQSHIESIELCLDEGLGFPVGTGVEFDLDGLLRMDTRSQIETLGVGVEKALFAPNEARKKLNQKPVKGGDTPFLQQQNWPISMLAERLPEQLNGGNSANTVSPEDEPVDEEQMLSFLSGILKEVENVKL